MGGWEAWAAGRALTSTVGSTGGGRYNRYGAQRGKVWVVQEIWEMPSDGNCLFHALVQAGGRRTSVMKAGALRSRIAAYIKEHAHTSMAGSSIAEWVRRDSQCDVEQYAASMARGAWGGGLEIAVFAHIEQALARVFTTTEEEGKAELIAVFGELEVPERRKDVSLLYVGGSHYNVVRVGQ